MESIGMLAGGLAHDFNNILSVVIGSMSLARLTIADHGALSPEELDETIEAVEEAASRAKVLVDQLLALSRPQEPTLMPVDLTQSVSHALKLLGGSLDKSIRVTKDLQADRALILADPVQIEQVLLNLCVNAAHAMTFMRSQGEPWGGTLATTLRRVKPDPAFLEAHPEATARDYWTLAVHDTGVGIDEESRPKLFTPFFSTKDPSEGTGLVLQLCKGPIGADAGCDPAPVPVTGREGSRAAPASIRATG